MSIKKSIFLFLLMMGVSFNVYSKEYTGTFYVTGKFGYLQNCPVIPGVVYDVSALSSCNAGGYHYSKPNQSGLKSYVDHIYADAYQLTLTNGLSVREKVASGFYCSLGNAYNPDTGLCEQEEICKLPEILDPDTNECVLPPFCERESTNEQLFVEEQACAAEGGIFTFECSDFLETLETRCTQSDKCAIGFPGWPDCIEDLDPTDPINQPGSGFNPGSPPTANPDGPTFDKPEPDEVIPTDTTDEAVLTAVQNLNRDSNEGFKALSIDLNNGFTDVNNSLSNLNSTNTAIGESIVDQLNQDYEIYQANKDLALQQTGAITAGASGITNALGSQTGTLTDALGNQTNALTGALGEQTDALTGALGELAEALPDKCEPTEENKWCQYPHGLGEGYIGDLFGQMDQSTNKTMDDGQTFIESALQDAIDSSLNAENETVINNSTSVLINALGFSQSCSPLTFDANGQTFSIDCDISQKIKLVLSFLIGIYTLMTLTDILLDGITPAGRKSTSTR